jgi:hypothetical protein
MDVSSSTAPSLVSSYTNTLLKGANAVHVAGRYAYIALEKGGGYTNQVYDMAVVDISDPSNPFLASLYDDGDGVSYGHDLFISGKYVYLLLSGGGDSSREGMRIIDISGIDAPGANIGDLTATTIEVGENLNVGNNLYVKSGLNVGSGGGIATDGSLSVKGTGYFLNTISLGASTTNAFDLRYNVVASSTFDIYDQISNTSRLSINSRGFLGLGTSSPIANFEVVSAATSPTNPIFHVNTGGSSHPSRTFIIKDRSRAALNGSSYPGSYAPALSIQDDGGAKQLWMSPLPRDSGNANARFAALGYIGLDFYMGGAATGPGTLALTLASTSVVGIGSGFSTTIIPNSLLEIRDASVAPKITLTAYTDTSTLDPAIIFRTGATPATKFIMGVDYSDSNKFKISPATFGTNDRLTINSSGRIGIGINNPISQMLHLGTVSAVTGSATATTTITLASSYLHLGGTEYAANSYRMITFGSTSDTSAFAFNVPAYFGYQETSVSNYAKGDLIFGTRSVVTDTAPTERMRITSAGNVGIGTSTPGAALNVIGAICVDDSSPTCANAARADGTIYAVNAFSQTLDLAESYPTKDTSLSVGEIVMLDSENPVFVKRAETENPTVLIGVVSTKPGFYLGGFNDELYPDDKKVPVALSGRVPVNVNLDGGEIKVGDPLTISSKDGIAKKATEAGKIIGYALEDFAGDVQTNATTTPQILVFMNITYWFPTSVIADNAYAADNSDGSNIISQSFDWILDQFKNIGLTIANGVVSAKEFIADKIKTKELEMTDSATGENYCVKISNGEWLKEKGACGETNVAPPPTDNPDAAPADNNVNENSPAQDENNTQNEIINQD